MNRRLLCVLVLSVMLVSALVPASAAYAVDDADQVEVKTWGIDLYPDPYPDLGNASRSSALFGQTLQQYASYNWVPPMYIDNMCQEVHFKRVGLGNGNDVNFVDSADISYFSGHGWDHNGYRCLLMADQIHDDRWVDYSDVKLGDGDLEWFLIDACAVLNAVSCYRWANQMYGLHLLCGASTDLVDAVNGQRVANLLVSVNQYDPPQTIKNSWFNGMDQLQPAGRILQIIGETTECGNEYLRTYAPLHADPPRDLIYTRWEYTCS